MDNRPKLQKIQTCCVVRLCGQVPQWRPVQDIWLLQDGEKLAVGTFELETIKSQDGMVGEFLVGWPVSIKELTVTDAKNRNSGDLQLPVFEPGKLWAPCFGRG